MQTNSFPPKPEFTLYSNSLIRPSPPKNRFASSLIRENFTSWKNYYDSFYASRMTTILRMQPSFGKKKKFLSIKLNFFWIDGTADDSGEREKSSQALPTLIKGRAGERVRTERENDSGALIKRNINQRDDMAMYKPLHLLLSRDASCFPSSGALLSLTPPPTEYRPELLRMWVFCMLFSTCVSILSLAAASFSRFDEHPFSCLPHEPAQQW